MPKKIIAPLSKLAVTKENTKPELKEWNKYAERRIKAARKSTQLSAKDFNITINT
jgi:DNA-binding transcriptional regulator YiaG